MSRKMIPPGYYPLFPWLAEQDQTSQAAFIAEFQDVCSYGMDRALGLQESTLDHAVQLHSQAIDLYKTAPWLSPLMGDVFEMGVRFLVMCLEVQMKTLNLMFSGISPETASPSATRAEKAIQELAMDIGSGQLKKPAGRQS